MNKLIYIPILIEYIIYVMYLNLYFKSTKNTLLKNIIYIISLEIITIIIPNFILNKVILMLINLLYLHCFYEGTMKDKILKLIMLHLNIIIMYALDYYIYDIRGMYLVRGLWLIEYFFVRKYLDNSWLINKKDWLLLIIFYLTMVFLNVLVFKLFFIENFTLEMIITFSLFTIMMFSLIYNQCISMTKGNIKLESEIIYHEVMNYRTGIVDTIEQYTKDYNKLVHDYKKQIKEQKIEKLILNIPHELINTNNVVLDMILNKYATLFREEEIYFFGNCLIKSNEPIEIQINNYDLYNLLTKLLDNALALSKLNKGSIRYQIVIEQYSLSIKIENKNINNNLINNEILKTNNQIKQICKKHNGLNQIRQVNNDYIQSCYLCFEG